MKQLESKDLILKITGEVQASNLAEFEQTALDVIGNINTTLTTDNDFAEAKENIKSCKAVEIRIANAKQGAIMSMEAVAEMMTVVDRLQDKFRDVRLLLEKTVKTEEARRKKEITDTGITNIIERIKSSPISHGYKFDNNEIISAIKGKRSLIAMQDAVDEVINEVFENINNLEETYTLNTCAINAAEMEYPGLFPDKKTIALQTIDTVGPIIEARIAKFRIAEMEKKEAEVKRLAAEKEIEAARLAEHQALVPEVPETKHEEPPIYELPPDPFLNAEIPPPPTFDDGPHKVITTGFNGSSEAAQEIIDMLLKLDGVSFADWSYARN